MDEKLGSRRIAGAIRQNKKSAKLDFLSISSLMNFANTRNSGSDEALNLLRFCADRMLLHPYQQIHVIQKSSGKLACTYKMEK
jgi:hypothetical protein